MIRPGKCLEGEQSSMFMASMASRRIAVTALSFGALYSPVFAQEQLSPAVPQAAVIPIHALSVGTTLNATVDYSNVSSSDLNPVFEDIKTPDSAEPPAAQAGLKRAIEVRIRGKAELSVIGREGEDQLVRLRMHAAEVSLVSDGLSANTEIGNIAECLRNGVVSAISSHGNVNKVWIRPEFGATAASSARTLISLTQFVLPEMDGKKVESWEAKEEDQTGRYKVRYSRQAGNGRMTSFNKEKLVFLPPKAKKSRTRNITLPVAYQPRGGMVVSFDTVTGQLLSIEGSESYDIVINGRNVGISETSFKLKRAGFSRMPAKKRAALLKEHAASSNLIQATSLWVAPSNAQMDNLLYRQKLGKETTVSLLAELAAAEKAADKNYKDTDLYQKFKALIYLHPESCHRLGKIAATADQKSLTFRLLIGAMTAIGNPAAQDAIAVVMHARAREVDFMMQLIPVLSIFEKPTVSTEQVLKELAYHNDNDDIVFTAQLALGALAANLADDEPARAQPIIDEFINRYPSPSDPRDISRVILVLGNSRLEQYLPTLQKYAEDPVPEVRSDAVYALRSFTGEKVEGILSRALVQDKDATTRREAAESLGYMEANDRVVAALKDAYASEGIDKIRGTILKSLWKFEKNYPEISQLLKQAAEKDESEDVRKAALSILNKQHRE